MNLFHCLFHFQGGVRTLTIRGDKHGNLNAKIARLASLVLVNPPRGLFVKDRLGLHMTTEILSEEEAMLELQDMFDFLMTI